MSKKKAKIKEDQYIKLCNDLNTQIENAYQQIKGLSQNLNALMKGNSEGPYWNGKNALEFYKTAKGNLNNDITAYKEATEAWAKLELRYINLLRRQRF